MHRVRRARRVFRGDGAPGRVRALPGGCLHEGLRVYTTLLSDAPGSRLPGGAPRRAGLRPPPRLSRPRGLRRPARQADRGGARGRAAGRGRQRRPVRRSGGRGEPQAREGLPQGRGLGRDRRGRAQVRRAHARATRRPPISASGAARSIRVQKDEKGRWQIAQLPAVEAALVSIDPRDGAIRALVGGFDFNRNTVQPRHAGAAPAGLELQALHLFGRAREGLHARRPSSTTRRSRSPPRRPAPSRGSRRTTTASSKGRCGCARRS